MGFRHGGPIVSPAGSTTGPPYATSVHPSGRYLLDQYGKPWLMAANQLLPAIHNAAYTDILTVIEDRASKGFNAQWMCLNPDAYIGANDNFSDFDGDLPYDASGNYSAAATSGATFWGKMDAVINACAWFGITAILTPIDTGSTNPTTAVCAGLTHARSQGSSACTTLGLFLGNRYKSFPNIIWLHGNDFGGNASWVSSQQTATDAILISNIASAIRAAGDTHLHCVELNYFRSLSTDDATTWASLVDLNGAYSYYQTYDCVLNGYNQKKSDNSAGSGAAIKPTFLMEANYEGADNLSTGTLAGTYCLRAQQYWTMLSGGCGQIWGNKTLHHFLAGWQTALNSAGSVQFPYWVNFFGSRKWYNLVPDTGNTFVTAGKGTYDSSTTTADGSTVPGSWATAALTADGSLGMCYCPQATTITVAMSKMRGSTTARWYDPAGNTYVTVTGSPFSNTGTQTFKNGSASGVSAVNNADGNPDWVLVLEA